jgi:glyoxylase-like metal-dependent hydrolase (beta-lactamase superfamily II)
MLKIGGAELRRVEEMTSSMPVSQFTADEEFVAQHAGWLRPAFLDAGGNLSIVYQSWILLLDDKLIVIDPCAGNDRSFPHFPVFHRPKTPYLERFEASGFRAEEVDFVFCTHLHADHCGWNTQLRGGRFVPMFPNARYVIVRREFERWDSRAAEHQSVRENAGAFETSVLPVLEAGLLDLVGDDHQIMPGLSIEASHGHTLGHACLHLQSEANNAYFAGDTFHSVIQLVDPTLDVGGADDLPALIASRRRLIRQCAERNALLIPAHFPAPHAGWIREQASQTVFVPVDGQI